MNFHQLLFTILLFKINSKDLKADFKVAKSRGARTVVVFMISCGVQILNGKVFLWINGTNPNAKKAHLRGHA